MTSTSSYTYGDFLRILQAIKPACNLINNAETQLLSNGFFPEMESRCTHLIKLYTILMRMPMNEFFYGSSLTILIKSNPSTSDVQGNLAFTFEKGNLKGFCREVLKKYLIDENESNNLFFYDKTMSCDNSDEFLYKDKDIRTVRSQCESIEKIFNELLSYSQNNVGTLSSVHLAISTNPAKLKRTGIFLFFKMNRSSNSSPSYFSDSSEDFESIVNTYILSSASTMHHHDQNNLNTILEHFF